MWLLYLICRLGGIYPVKVGDGGCRMSQMLPLDSKTMKHFCKTQTNMYYPTSGSMSDFYRSWQSLKGINIHQHTAALCRNDRVEPGTPDVKVLAWPNYCCSGQLRLQGCRPVLACAGLNRHPGVAVLSYISSHWFSAGSAESTHKERRVPHLWTAHPVYTGVAQKRWFSDGNKNWQKWKTSLLFPCMCWELCRMGRWR